MSRVLNMSEFWIFVYFRKCDTVLNMRLGFWMFKDSKYTRILRMQVLNRVLNMSECGWIMPMAGFWTCLVNVSLGFKLAQNMGRLWKCEGYTGCWIYCLSMLEYASITPNMIWYASIYLKKQSAGYVRILNVADEIHSIRSLCKLLSSYRDRRIQNTVKHLRWSVL